MAFMMLIDANILIYAAVEDAALHNKAKKWLDTQLNGSAPVGIPWVSLNAFLRITTNVRIFNPPASPQSAWNTVSYWLECPVVWTPEPKDHFTHIMEHIIGKTNPSGNLFPDVFLAALAMDHGLTLYSTDNDFARFSDLTWNNPLG
jgi:uncharacterized protein